METLKNKIYALVLLATGYLSTRIEGDYTFCIFTMIIGAGLFFSKKKVID